MEVSITRALSELKLLDKRINRAINEAIFAGYLDGDKPMAGFQNKEEIEARAKSDFQSVKDLIKRRNAIKSAIVVSNATTDVEIAGKTMTVAEAIERKTSIEYEKKLLQKLKNTYTTIVSLIEDKNEEVKERLDRQLEGFTESAKKATDSQVIQTFIDNYLAKNEYKFVDPLNIKKVIEELTKDIEDFESEVDFALSTSNTITKITIPD